LLVKATTTAVSDAFGSKAITSGFIYIKGPEILSKYVGVAEERIAQLFRRTREHKKKHGFPAVLFIDEAEAILSKRGTGISSDVNNTIVPAFLSEMDGLEETGAVIILATNRSDILDPAVVQEGRIDKKIHVGRPDQASAIDIFNVHMRNIPLGPKSDREELVDLAAKEIFCPKKKMYKVILKDPTKNNKYFTFGNLCSGGMIAEIVQNASSHAMRRNKEEKTKRKHWGVTSEDIKNAVRNSFIQNYHINHTDDVTLFVEGFRQNVKAVEKVTITV
jgi:proteasome-associated ATPase